MPMPGWGTVLKVTISASATPIGDIKGISGPGLSSDMIDVTTLDSSNNAREFYPGLFDGGEVTFDVVMNPTNATQQYLHDSCKTRPSAAETFSIEWNDGSSTAWDFTAWVQSFEPQADVDGVVIASITLKVTGPVTLP